MTTATPDYTAAITTAALFDTSSAGKPELTGPDAPLFLGNLCTNDTKNLPLGGGCEAYFCDSRAKVQFAAWIYHVKLGDGRHAMWVETTPGRNSELVKYLDRYLISEQVEIADVTDRFAQFHLAGPLAVEIVAKAIGEVIPELPEFAHMERTFGATATCSIRRRDQLGVPGFDIVCLRERAEGVRGLLESSGALKGTPETFEVLRIEAGTPIYGIDIDADRSVMEVGRFERAVSYAKGCFLGQEPIVMARDRTGHAVRSFLGLKVLEGGPLPSGSKLLRDGQEVGVVTSSTFSPRLGLPVALGYLKWKHQDPGLRLEAQTPAGSQSVEVVGLPPVPFVKSNS
jgi:glycine cleavage system aminomethyltransferase T